ncbi:MAG: hypothetical protein M0P58_13580 [Bacteroidales bacterium]|nr:hypothetical protein [Bacteroidales bacterium]
MANGRWLLPYLLLIRKIIYNLLIKPGYFPPAMADDLFQQVQELLLLRQDKILGNFLHKAKFETYLAAIITNLCYELRNKEWDRKLKIPVIHPFSWNDPSSSPTGKLVDGALLPDDKLIIRETLLKLHLILQLFCKDRLKIIFCLKALYHLPVFFNNLDVNGIMEDEKMQLSVHLANLNNRGDHITNREVYSDLTGIFKIVEKKDNSDDAIRKWIESRVREIIDLLNGNPAISSFEAETFQHLFELYCHNSYSFSPKPEKKLSDIKGY